MVPPAGCTAPEWRKVPRASRLLPSQPYLLAYLTDRGLCTWGDILLGHHFRCGPLYHNVGTMAHNNSWRLPCPKHMHIPIASDLNWNTGLPMDCVVIGTSAHFVTSSLGS